MDLVKMPSGHLVALSPNRTLIRLRTDMRKFQKQISEVTGFTYECIMETGTPKSTITRIHLTEQ